MYWRPGLLVFSRLLFSLDSTPVTAQSAPPALYDGGVVNGADFTPAFSPGILVSLFGTNLAKATVKATGFPLPAALDGVSVDVQDGGRVMKAPLFFVSTGQVNALLPYEVSGESVQIRLANSQGATAWQTLAVAKRSPRLLTKTANGRGEPVLTHANYTLVTNASPALAGEVVILFLTGLGEVSPAVATGGAAGDGTAGRPLNRTIKPVTIKLNGATAAVKFAGLAPGYAGLYQVNFEVPAGTAPGAADIQVSVDSESSQDGITFACAPKLEPLAIVNVPASGGTVAAGGAILTIPAGAFPADETLTVSRATTGVPSEPAPLTDVFALGGLPDSIQGSIAVSLPMHRNLAAGARPLLVLQSSGGARMYIDAIVEGDRVVATLPDRTAAAQQHTSRTAAEPLPGDVEFLLFVLSVAAPAAASTDDLAMERSDHFVLYYKPRIMPAEAASILLDRLESEAMPKVTLMGFSLDRLPKLGVQIEYTGPVRSRDCGGIVNYSHWSGRPVLLLDAGLLADSTYSDRYHSEIGMTDLLVFKTAHLLGHLLTQPGPPDKTLRNRWVWMDEAAASYLEWVMTYPIIRDTPPQTRDNWVIDSHGLEYWAHTEDASWLRNHGFGAVRFLGHLGSSGRDYFGKLYAFSKSAYLPVEALRAEPAAGGPGFDLSSEWKKFVEEKSDPYRLVDEYMTNRESKLSLSTRRRVLSGETAQETSFAWDARDLSAQVFPVRLGSKPASGMKLSGVVTGTSNISATFFKVPESGDPSVLAKAMTLADLDASTFDAGDQIWVVVVNSRLVSPFTGITPVAVTISLMQPNDLLARMKSMPGVRVRLAGVDTTCADDKGATMTGCGDWLFYSYTGGSQTAPPSLPINWTGETFTVDSYYITTTPTDSIRLEMFITATYDPASQEMRNGVMRKKQTWQSAGSWESTEFKFRSLPLVLTNTAPEPYWRLTPSDIDKIAASVYDVKYDSMSSYGVKTTLTEVRYNSRASAWLALEKIN